MTKIIIVVSLLGLVIPLFAQDSSLKASFKTTKSPDERIRDMGTANVVITAGGFGTVTFKSKDGKITVIRPVYPPGHVLSKQELEDELRFEWPANMTVEFLDFTVSKQKEIGINRADKDK